MKLSILILKEKEKEKEKEKKYIYIYKQNKLKAKRNNFQVMMQEIHRAAVPQRAYMVYNMATNRFLWDFSAKTS